MRVAGDESWWALVGDVLYLLASVSFMGLALWKLFEGDLHWAVTLYLLSGWAVNRHDVRVLKATRR